ESRLVFPPAEPGGQPEPAYVPAPDGGSSPAPGALGRAALVAGEVSSLRFPAQASGLLTRAAGQLLDAGDMPAAIHAYLLAALAAARARLRHDADRAWQAVQPLLTGYTPPAGWHLRID